MRFVCMWEGGFLEVVGVLSGSTGGCEVVF